MGGKKPAKPFIRRKEASTFQLVCRATEDGEDEGALDQERDFALISGPPLDDNGERYPQGEALPEADTRSMRSQSQYSRSGRLSRARRAELIQVRAALARSASLHLPAACIANARCGG